jgi:hypothetical protein
VVVRRQLKRRYVPAFFEEAAALLGRHRGLCLVTPWSRELQALGHTVRLMPPAYVKPYVKRQKNDTADAEAICEAVTRTICGLCQLRRPSNKAGGCSIAHAPSVHPAADLGDQCDPGSPCRVWRHCSGRTQRHGGTTAHHRGHVNRTQRPNTWLHRPSLRREDSPCQLGAVHTWPETSLSAMQDMSDVGGEADMPASLNRRD